MCNIYLAECPERAMLKIGKSKRPDQRVRGLTLTVKGEWRLVDWFFFGSEWELHRSLRPFRHPSVSGREWYVDCPEVRDAFKDAKADLLQQLRSRERATHIRFQQARESWRLARQLLKTAIAQG